MFNLHMEVVNFTLESLFFFLNPNMGQIEQGCFEISTRLGDVLNLQVLF